jgi:exodeoxyribonuclease VII large subunit
VFEGSGSRQVRATALGRGTHGVPDVRRLVEAQFHVAFPHRVWVAGEVGRPAQADDGLRFPLRASTGEDPFWLPCVVPADGLAAVRDLLGRAHDADVEDVVREGRLARVGGLLRYDAARGAVVLLVSELDPTPTALELVDARSAALAAVVDAGLVDAQRPLRMATAPLQLALVAPRGDAALVRVQEQLAAGPYDVDLDVHETDLTGPDAGARLAAAVRAAGAGSDVVLAVRERGRPLGLASYDALEAAQAVAEAPVPVVAALGGEGTRTAFDEVAWASLPTAQEAVDVAARPPGGRRAPPDRARSRARARGRGRGHPVPAALDEVRAETAAAAEQAATRSVEVRRRRRLQLRVACALVAVAVLVAALALDRPLLLLGLLAPVLALAAVELWWRSPARRSPMRRSPTSQSPTTQSPTSTRSTMSRRDEDFTQVLSRLQAVRDELRTTTSPERVAVLRSLADELVADGERLLGVHLRAPAAAPPQASAELPAADADGARRPEPTRPVEEQVG